MWGRGKGIESRCDEVGVHSRFDFGSRWSPLSDELLTTLHNLGIPPLLIGQPRAERPSATKSIVVKGGCRGELELVDENDGDGEESGQRNERRKAGRHGKKGICDERGSGASSISTL